MLSFGLTTHFIIGPRNWPSVSIWPSWQLSELLFSTRLMTDHTNHHQSSLCAETENYRRVLLTYYRRLYFVSIIQLLFNSCLFYCRPRGRMTPGAVSWHIRRVLSSSSAYNLLSTSYSHMFQRRSLLWRVDGLSVVVRRCHVILELLLRLCCIWRHRHVVYANSYILIRKDISV